MADERWHITFHGGADAHGRNNMHAYALDGRTLGSVLDDDDLPQRARLRELRGFEIGPDGLLYVANAAKKRSQILRFDGAVDRHGRHRFVDVFTEGRHHNSGLEHPFMVAFGPDGHLYVPSQDTRVVTRYFGGIMLGAGGLIRAYTEGAVQAIEASEPIERVLGGYLVRRQRK